MSTSPVLAYLHGVGGVRPGWSQPLLVDPSIPDLRIVAPSYSAILSGADRLDEAGESDGSGDVIDGQVVTRAVVPDEQERAAYLRRQQALAARVANCPGVVPAGSAWPALLPRPNRWPIVDILDSPARFIGGLDQARRYLREPSLRRRVLDQVRSHLEPLFAQTSGPVVVIGHSLGALVALDVLAETDQSIDLLVTLGAPLSHPDISERLVGRGINLAMLGGWLNVVHLLDPVPTGRGAQDFFPAATDVFLPMFDAAEGLGGWARSLGRAATAHLDSTYLSHDVVRTLIADALAGPPRQSN
jgi:hypothetical protein